MKIFRKTESIHLPAKLAEELRSHAIAEYPSECCGIIFGKYRADGGVEVSEFVKVQNEVVAGTEKDRKGSYSDSNSDRGNNRDNNSEKNRHYRIDPLKLYEFEKEYAVKGFEIIGFFHSHPDAPAILSKEDEHNMIPGQIYMIIEIRYGEYSGMRIWRKGKVKIEELAKEIR